MYDTIETQFCAFFMVIILSIAGVSFDFEMSFWYLQFSQETNEKNSSLLLWYLKSNCFSEELKTQKRHSEIN